MYYSDGPDLLTPAGSLPSRLGRDQPDSAGPGFPAPGWAASSSGSRVGQTKSPPDPGWAKLSSRSRPARVDLQFWVGRLSLISVGRIGFPGRGGAESLVLRSGLQRSEAGGLLRPDPGQACCCPRPASSVATDRVQARCRRLFTRQEADSRTRTGVAITAKPGIGMPRLVPGTLACRSEERRVGKECLL